MWGDFLKNQLWGTHRGTVMENNDPQKLGRIKVYVQAAYGTSSIAELPWAYPKFAKPGDFYVPEIGEAVYVEFLCTDGEPDSNNPIWTGAWSSLKEIPSCVVGDDMANAHYYRVERTAGGHCIEQCDKPGGEYIKITSAAGATILMDSSGNIKINGKIIYLN